MQKQRPPVKLTEEEWRKLVNTPEPEEPPTVRKMEVAQALAEKMNDYPEIRQRSGTRLRTQGERK